MFRKIDCIRINIPDLNKALEFYQNKLGLNLLWRRNNTVAGLKMQESDTELVLVTEENKGTETDILVESVEKSAEEFKRLGGKVVVQPFDIAIGRCAVVEDPWRNRFVILDMSKGMLKTDSQGNVLDEEGKAD